MSPEILSTPRQPTALELERLEMDDPEQESQIEHDELEEQDILPKDIRGSKDSLGAVFGDGTSFKNEFNRNHTFVVPTSTSTG